MTSVLPAAGVISFARGVPAGELLPLAALEQAAVDALQRDGRTAANYGPPGGYGPLREWVAARHGVAPHCVLLTPGSMLCLNMLLAELVGHGDTVAVEAPTYDRALTALAAAPARVAAVRRGDGGLDLDAIPDAARLLYVQPTFHNPTGATLTRPRRLELARLAVERGLLVLEDDPYGLVRFEGEPQPTVFELLHELGAGDLAIRVSSFSKSVAPGLRVGYAVLPERLAPALERRAVDTYVSPPLLAQAQLHAFLDAGALEPHLATLGRELRRRRDALVTALAESLPGAGCSVPQGGYFLWLALPGGVGAEALHGAAAERGVAIVPGGRFGGGDGHARLAFSFLSPAEIAEGCRRLAAAYGSAAA